jgi:2-polyprenyl-3-methyl-5-hydroxy-6-metoxy-1,4-benzoquinol methylase
MNKNYRNIFYKNYFSDKTNKGLETINPKNLEKWIKATTVRIINWLPKSKNIKVLDIGCGYGNLLLALKNAGYNNLTGIDISEEQIKVAQQLSNDINFICSDLIAFLRENKQKFDAIFAFDVLEHLDKEEALTSLELIYNNLNEGGQLIIQTPNAESPWFGSVAFGDFTHEWFYTASSLEDVLLKSGFREIEFKPSEPLLISFKSLIRKIIWSIIKLFLIIWNLAETGSMGSKIYTRVFLARALK